MGDGQGRVNLEVILEALRRGYSITLIASDIDESLRSNPAVTWFAVDVDSVPSELLRNQVFAWKSSRILKRIRNHVDLVLVNGAITYADSDINAVHMVHSAWLASPYHSSRGHYDPGALYQLLYTFVNARWERRAFRKTRALVAVSGLLGEQIISLGIPEDKVRIIPNGVDVTEFHPGQDAAPQSIPEDIPEDRVVCLFAGDIKRSLKNLDSVLEALREHESALLLVAGDTTGSHYPELARRLGVSDRVRFLGYRRDLPDLMRRSDIFVFPSRYESFSLVLLEAMASAIPVVTASTVGAASLVSESAGIVLEDPDDVASLSRAMGTLIASPELRESMGRAGREIASACTFARMAEDYVDLIEKMCVAGEPAMKSSSGS
ncbi:MAG: glycosyltransferase family 4 protein [Rhodothermales bacterium]|nr:glycosyltransferase family 4 protein [Rhodothermales bacterium]